MSYYILIRGPLGVGKSTLAKRLAKVLRAKHVSMDSILEKEGLDKITHYSKCIPAKNFVEAQDTMLPDVKKKLKTGKIVIFDACFYHKEQILHLIRNLQYPHFVFTLKAPLKVCVERDSRRKKTYGKAATRAVHSLVSRFDYGIVIDTDGKTAPQTAKEILSHLPKSK